MVYTFDPNFYQRAIPLPDGCYLLQAHDSHGGDYDIYVNERYVGSRQTEFEATTHAKATWQRTSKFAAIPETSSTPDVMGELVSIERQIKTLCDAISTDAPPTPSIVLTRIRLKDALLDIHDAQRSYQCAGQQRERASVHNEQDVSQ